MYVYVDIFDFSKIDLGLFCLFVLNIGIVFMDLFHLLFSFT